MNGRASPAARRSIFADAAAAQRAIDFIAPLLEKAAGDEAINQSHVVYVVVLDAAMSPPESSFEEAVLLEAGFGLPRERWDADYAGFARAKAQLSWESGVDSHVLQMTAPQRMRGGNSRLWGSVVLDGIVVAVSGCVPAIDEALAGCVAMALRAQAKLAAAPLLGTV